MATVVAPNFKVIPTTEPAIVENKNVPVGARDSERFAGTKKLRICLITPRFEPSFWGYQYSIDFLPGNYRCRTVTGAMPALAALVPEAHDVVIIDENVEDIDLDSLRGFDVLGITGMIVQRKRMFELLEAFKDIGPVVVAGGPYVTVAPEEFEDRCDVMFLGEAETTWPVFLTSLAKGETIAKRYEQDERTDMTTVPAPRYDLLKKDRYLQATLQFSRGCPFLCEFCDIITIFGRRPRTKLPEQMLREMDAIRDAGFTSCFLVDDNFIGNKAKAREFLIELIEWQERNGYPIRFMTEASIDLADQPELIDLMARAYIREVFIGIESPRAESLKETRKNHNVRGDGMLEKIERIRDGGLVPMAGFIVGFDSDDEQIFEEQYRFIQASGIAKTSVAILTPIPTTPLYDRLAAEGRLELDRDDVIFTPKQMSREALIAGRRNLIQKLYLPDAFFTRLFDGYVRSESFRQKRHVLDSKSKKVGLVDALTLHVKSAKPLFRLLADAMSAKGGTEILSCYWKYWRKNRGLPKGQAISYISFLYLCLEHWHFYRITHSSLSDYFGQVYQE